MSIAGCIRLVLGMAGLVLAGCGTAPLQNAAARPQPRELTFIQPWLLYTAASPYVSLTVEVDAVAGAEPRQEWLDELRVFLSRHCRKPGGVRVVRSDTIPQSLASRQSSAALALRYINGPPEGSAFMYVLYYNSALNPSLRTANPHAVAFPYPCAIFVDRNFNVDGFGDRLGGAVLQHEAGHLIGAARDPAHGDGAHCAKRDCLMSAAFEYNPMRRWVGLPLAPQQHLCADCLADMARSRAALPASRLSFSGPLFRRSEGAYQVLSLPGAIHLHCGPASGYSRAAVLTMLRAAAAAGLRSREGFILSAAAAGTRDEVLAAINAAAHDPAAPVRTAASMLRKKTGL